MLTGKFFGIVVGTFYLSLAFHIPVIVIRLSNYRDGSINGVLGKKPCS